MVAPTFHEALHGVCCGATKKYTNSTTGYTSTGIPTSFPHALALGATFNRTLWGMVGEVIGIESRALRNENGEDCRGPFFAPNVNLYVKIRNHLPTGNLLEGTGGCGSWLRLRAANVRLCSADDVVAF